MILSKLLVYLLLLFHPQNKFLLLGAGGVDAAGPTYTDNFNRADSNTLGGQWVESEEGATCGGACVRIVSNQLALGKVGGVGGNGLTYYNDTTPNDQYAQWTFQAAGVAGQDRALCVRVSGGLAYTNFSAYCLVLEDGNLVRIRKWVAEGLQTVRQGTSLDSTSTLPANGDVLRIQVTGTTILAKKNGSNYLNATDSSIASGKGGFYVREGTGAVGAMDDWSSGGL